MFDAMLPLRTPLLATSEPRALELVERSMRGTRTFALNPGALVEVLHLKTVDAPSNELRRDSCLEWVPAQESEKMLQPHDPNAHVVLAKRPTGRIDESCFRIEDCEEPCCGVQDVLVQAI